MVNKNLNIMHSVCMALALIGIVMFVLAYKHAWLVLAIASLALFLIRMFIRLKEKNKTTLRLMGILLFGAVLLMGSAYLMYRGRRYWVLPLLIDAAIELYVSLRMGHVEE